jgi:hypothetical protein
MPKVMNNMNWMILALLAVTMTAVAQQPASAPQNQQPVAATQPERTAAQPSQTQSGQAQSNLAPPTTMDQVVDRVIMREKGTDQVLVAAYSDCGDLSPEPDAGSAAGADSAGRSLLSWDAWT